MIRGIATTLVLTGLLAACGEASNDGGSGAGSPTGAGGEGGVAPEPDPYAALYECPENDFGEIVSLSGPGFDPEVGIIGAPQASYVVSTTMLYWKEDKRAAFYGMGGKLIDQLDVTPGLLAYALGTDDTCRVARSIAIWRSEEDMYAFVLSGAHAEAMGMTLDLSNTGRSTHWDATPEELDTLDWTVANAKLDDVERSEIYEGQQ